MVDPPPQCPDRGFEHLYVAPPRAPLIQSSFLINYIQSHTMASVPSKSLQASALSFVVLALGHTVRLVAIEFRIGV